MEGLIIVSFVLGIISILLIILLIDSIKSKNWFDIIMGGIFLIISICFEIVIISVIINTPPEPTALDVYRGLTELEITSVNGVPKDTVVVFKNR